MADYISSYSGEEIDTLLGKVNTPDSAPAALSEKLVTSGGVYDALAEKQDTLTFDPAPTASSTNPVTSGGIKTAIDAVQSDTDTKADLVSGATAGHLASLTASGNLADSGKQASDFATAAQGALADSAYQKPSGGIPKSDLSSAVQTSLDKADSAIQDISSKADKDADAVEGNVAEFDSSGNPVDSGISADNVAQQDGYYTQMTTGLAENLVDTKGTGTEQSFVFRTSCGDVSITDDGSAVVQKFLGTSTKFNQLVKSMPATTTTKYGVTATYDGNGKITFSGESTTTSSMNFTAAGASFDFIEGHKYLIKGVPSGGGTSTYRLWTASSSAFPVGNRLYDDGEGGIATAAADETLVYTSFFIQVFAGANVDGVVIRPQIFDLTAMGIADDISSVSDFTEWLANNIGVHGYYGYTEGMLLSNRATGIKTVGFNQWDEEVTKGARSSGTGEIDTSYAGTWITNTNLIEVFPNTNYYISNSVTGRNVYVFYFDSGKNFVSRNISLYNNYGGEFTTPDNCYYIAFSYKQADLDSNICINLSWSGYRNGEYEPYWSETRTKDLTALTGKLNGSGSSVTIFPDGLKKVGDVRDEIDGTKAIKRVGSVDLGSLSFAKTTAAVSGVTCFQVTIMGSSLLKSLCSKYIMGSATRYALASIDKAYAPYNNINSTDVLVIRDSAHDNSTADDFKTAMAGVKLYYELATPLEYTLDEAFNTTYKVADFGTEQVVPSELDSNNLPQTGAFSAVIKYNTDFTRELVNLPENYVPRDEVESSLETKADVDGTYPLMTVGTATNLKGRGSVSAQYTFRTAGGTADIGSGSTTVEEFEGRSLVWNQLFSKGGSYSAGGITLSFDSETGIYTLNGTAEGAISIYMNTSSFIASPLLANHYGLVIRKYVGGTFSGGANSSIKVVSKDDAVFYFASTTDSAFISTHTTARYAYISILSGDVFTNYQFRIQCFDLTLMFGSGYEPSTVDEFRALYPLDYYSNNTGAIVNNKAAAIETVGFNQWDEEWEVGSIDGTTGANMSNTTNIRSKNYIRVLPSNAYYFKAGAGYFTVYFYDGNKRYLRREGVTANRLYTIQADVQFIRFVMSSNYGTTYNNDICINLSWSGYRNGEYEPYWKSTYNINIPTITGKLNGEGESVTIFPDGMKSAGTAHDSLTSTKAVKRIGVVDLGDLDWDVRSAAGYASFRTHSSAAIATNSSTNALSAEYTILSTGDVANTNKSILIYANNGNGQIYLSNDDYSGYTAAQVKVALSGIKLYYELATPLEYTLDSTLAMNYRVDDFGTERRLPDDTADEVNAPIVYNVQYAMNAVDTLRNLPKNYIGKDSMDAILTALQTAGVISSYTLTYDSTNGRYNCTISA